MKEIYTDFTNYNLWANKKMVDFYLSQPMEMMDQMVENSFPSARLTFLHIWDAENIWLERLKGNPTTSFPSKNFTGTAEEGLKLVVSNSVTLRDFVKAQKGSFFEQKNTYQNTKGELHSQLNREILHHVCNHSTYHRGQLLMMARQLELKNMPSTDYIFFLREKE